MKFFKLFFLKILLLDFPNLRQSRKAKKDNSVYFSSFSTLLKKGLGQRKFQPKLQPKFQPKLQPNLHNSPQNTLKKTPKSTEKTEKESANQFSLPKPKVILENFVAIVTGIANVFLVIALIKQTSLPKPDLAYQNFFVHHPLESPTSQNISLSEESFSPLKIISYTVKPGDTLWSIAKETGINLDTILSFNHIDNSHKLMPKTTLNIPLQNGILHKIEKESTTDLEELSTRYAISVEKIRYFNQKSGDDYLFIPGATLSFSERLRLYGKEFFSPLGVRNVKVTSFFGFRIHPIHKNRSFHRGIDLSCPIGTPIYAAKAGIVVNTVFSSGYGMLIIISHGQNTYTRYAHLSKFNVKPGQRVQASQIIGLCGNTGSSTGPHLHFEVLRGNKMINPIYLTDLARKK